MFNISSPQGLSFLTTLLPKEIAIHILHKTGSSVLVMVYHRALLETTIFEAKACSFLRRLGYPCQKTCLTYLECLADRFNLTKNACGETFPHEVGLFLGYPVEDVSGFIRHKGMNYKLCGYWKVYGDVDYAVDRFSLYDRCRQKMHSAVCTNENMNFHDFNIGGLQ